MPTKTKRRPRTRPVPPTVYPLGAEQDYAVDLVRLFTRWWNETMQALGAALNLDVLAQAGTWRRDEAVEDVIDAARAKWGEKVDRFRPTIERAGRSVDRVAKASLANQIEAAGGLPSEQFPNGMGIRLFDAEPQIAEALTEFTAENVRLIKSIGEDAATRLESTVTDWVKSGRLTPDLVKQLQEEYGYDRRRAQVIARDQIGKLNGNLNRIRQQSVGVKSYIWHSMQDGRVRKEHALRNGQEFSWETPPPDGHPGQPVQCRCTPTPKFDKAKDFGLNPAEIAEEEAEDQARAARRQAQIAARQARTKEVKAEIKTRQQSEAEARKLSPSYPPAPKPDPEPPALVQPRQQAGGRTIPVRPPSPNRITAASLREQASPPPASARPKRQPDEPLSRHQVNLNEVNWSAEEKARSRAQREALQRQAEAAIKDPTPLTGFRLKPGEVRPAKPAALPTPQQGLPLVGELYTHAAFGQSRVLSVSGQMALIETPGGKRIRTNIKLLGFTP